MLKEFIDAVVGDLRRSDFGDGLKALIDDARKAIFEQPSRKQGNEPQSYPKEGSSHWSKRDLRVNLHSHAISGSHFERLPQSIDLSGVGQALTRLRDQSKDGLEYGRACHVRLWDGKLELGETTRGRDQVSIVCKSAPHIIPVMMIHTHPAFSHSSLSPIHFSPQDFQSFFSIPSLSLSVVMAPKAELLMVKTAQSPTNDHIDPEFFDKVYDQVAQRLFVSHEKIQARATQVICKKLNLGLYIRKPDVADFIFRSVDTKS